MRLSVLPFKLFLEIQCSPVDFQKWKRQPESKIYTEEKLYDIGEEIWVF